MINHIFGFFFLNWKPTASPSSAVYPTLLPVLSPECESLAKGEVFRTNSTETIDYKYDLLTTTTVDTNEAIRQTENSLTSSLGSSLMNCNDRRKLISGYGMFLGIEGNTVLLNWKGRLLEVNGLDTIPADKVDTSSDCSSFQVEVGTKCEVIDGSLTLYLREGMDESDKRAASADALKTAKDIMNSGALDDASFGILGVRFVESVATNSVRSAHSANPISKVGLGGIVVACTVILVAVFSIVNKKSHRKRLITERYLDDDESVFTMTNWLHSDAIRSDDFLDKPLAHILCDDDGIYTKSKDRDLITKTYDDACPTEGENYGLECHETGLIFESTIPKYVCNRSYATGDTVDM